MKVFSFIVIVLFTIITFNSCISEKNDTELNIIFLHHSTGEYIWNGKPPSLFRKAIKKISPKLDSIINKNALIPSLFKSYNNDNDTNYSISEIDFPKAYPYGWNNYPFDYYNIWVKNAGEMHFNEEPTLEILTKDYQVIIFKHCYPVSSIKPDLDSADINSYVHTVSNYKLQYKALRDKLNAFPDNKFIVFTGAVQVKANLPEDEARRAQVFFDWVKNDWDQPGDNIYLWDLYTLQTEGGLYFKDEFAVAPDDSHPNKYFAKKVAELLFNRIIDVIENDGKNTLLTGVEK